MGTDRTAVLLLDVQNAFIDPAGSCTALLGALPGIEQVIDECRALLEEARHRGIPVIYTQHAFERDYSDVPPRLASILTEPSIGVLQRDTWDTEIYPAVAPRDGEVVVRKTRYDAFIGTALADILGSAGTERLVIAGLMTQLCIASTARAAEARDFDVHVATDCVTAPEDLHEAALRALGSVVTLSPWRDALSPARAEEPGSMASASGVAP